MHTVIYGADIRFWPTLQVCHSTGAGVERTSRTIWRRPLRRPDAAQAQRSLMSLESLRVKVLRIMRDPPSGALQKPACRCVGVLVCFCV
jgi:hypothetical protein